MFIMVASLVSIPNSYSISFIYVKNLKSYNDIILTDSSLTSRPIASGFDFPTGMAFVGPGEILVIEKNTGKVILY